MFGMYDNLFDMNHDGKLDTFEKAAKYTALTCLFESTGYDDKDVFGDAGLDYEELEMMDPEERDGILEEAGLDPCEFDF